MDAETEGGVAVLGPVDDELVGPLKRLGIPDAFAVKYGSQDDLMQLYGLQPPQIAA